MKKFSYSRSHLRSPCKISALFEDDGFVYKVKTLNVSEGGILLDQISHLPMESIVPMMIPIPQFPEFKNYDLEKLRNFSKEMFPNKVIRVMAKMVRRDGETVAVDDVFKSRIGIQFAEISPQSQKVVADYVAVYSGNIVRLQQYIEGSSSFEEYLESARILGQVLGYPSDIRLAELRQLVAHDYMSLQWL